MSFRPNTSLIIAGLVAVSLTTGLWAEGVRPTTAVAPTSKALKIKTRKAAPPYSMTLVNDEKRTVQQHLGKVVMVNFWATWCAPCRAEMPVLHRVHKDFQAKGLETYGVLAMDSSPKDRIVRMGQNLSYKLAMKGEGALNPIKNKIPTTILIDRKGVVRYAILGTFKEEDLRKKLLTLLNETP